MSTMNSGVFIVLEGTDGSGKGTQCTLLIERLKNEGYDVAEFDFPQYQKPSSYFVQKYLNGEYGSAEDVGPYTASMFYALDRYEAAPAIKEALDAGKVVIANRFTGSNMAHQGTKFDDDAERKGYFLWLEAIEFQMLGIPRPDISLVLRVPAETAQTLVDKKDARPYTDRKRDIHEADLEHLKKSVKIYDNLCQLFPKDFKVLDCVRNQKLLEVDAVHKLVWETIHPLLPVASARTPAKPYAYYIPDALDTETRQQYIEITDSIYKLRDTLEQSLVSYIEDHADTPPAERDDTWRAEIMAQINHVTHKLKPLASHFNHTNQLPVLDDALARSMETQLPDTYSNALNPVTLTSVWPRNELDLAARIAYAYTDKPLADVIGTLDTWTYDQKATLFAKSVETSNTLTTTIYEWDVVGDYDLFNQVSTILSSQTLLHQQLTPRYGYEIPELVELAGQTDVYETCFDASLKLYSILQSAGQRSNAQYATLHGHKLRWTMTISALELKKLIDASKQGDTQSDLRRLTKSLYERAHETHPLLWQSFNA